MDNAPELHILVHSAKMQDGKAPKPTEEGVYLDRTSEFEVYVGTYGGFSSEDKIVEQVIYFGMSNL